MAPIRLAAQVAPEDFLRAIEEMPDQDLILVVTRALAVRAERAAPHLTKGESEVMARINAALSPSARARLDELTSKRKAETLTSEEYDELTRLTDDVEQIEAARAQALIELAQLRQTTLKSVMHDLAFRALVTDEERRRIVEAARGCCEYCLSPALFAPQSFSLELDRPGLVNLPRVLYAVAEHPPFSAD